MISITCKSVERCSPTTFTSLSLACCKRFSNTPGMSDTMRDGDPLEKLKLHFFSSIFPSTTASNPGRNEKREKTSNPMRCSDSRERCHCNSEPVLSFKTKTATVKENTACALLHLSHEQCIRMNKRQRKTMNNV
uniref:Uncharacterized protein n=1 Tax=Nelumbo nucifera TaxID=4432 RepID=A0A822XS18_NELNU|nr:TPA_asm: hypothetical protein HUJ06_023068 [Nelumbo nucifera]